MDSNMKNNDSGWSLDFPTILDFTSLDFTSFYNDETWMKSEEYPQESLPLENSHFDPLMIEMDQYLTPPPTPPESISAFPHIEDLQLSSELLLNETKHIDMQELQKSITTKEQTLSETPTDFDVEDIWKYINTDYNEDTSYLQQISLENNIIDFVNSIDTKTKQETDKILPHQTTNDTKLEECTKQRTMEKKNLTKKVRRKARNHPNNCYHLWDFIRDGLNDPKVTYVVWVKQSEGEFRITNTSELSRKWGYLKNSKNMTYDKLSRSLRYYCSLNVLEKVPGTRLQFRFGKRRTWTKVRN
ncbi:ETS homologous factor-like isoform X1 [Clytia hemisphaerica]